MIKFMSERHKQNFFNILGKMGKNAEKDPYHLSVAYLFALDEDCYRHIGELFNFKERVIKPDGLFSPWQTSTSLKTCRLAFNLWNSFSSDPPHNGEEEYDKNSYRYSVDFIFCCCLAPYYWEAVKIRYPEYTGNNLIV